MTALLVLLLLTGAPAKTAPADAPTAAKVTTPAAITSFKALDKLKPQLPHASETKCGACHSTANWTEVRFNHDRTGFSLRGAHAATVCKSCHVKDFDTALPRTCAGCHRDVHSGDLGSRCESCHDAYSWSSRLDVAAHRRSTFPLLGGHAALPCNECHLEARERRFSRTAVDCLACHALDVQRTVGTALDHTALGFTLQPCRSCHNAFGFKPARYPGHDACFVITAGAHAGISCDTCHQPMPTNVMPGTCSTNTAACTACHEHECSMGTVASETDAIHANVPGYSCTDRKCYDCHQFDTGARP